MNNKAFSRNCNTKEVPDIASIVGKITVSGGTDLIKLGYFHGSRGMKAEYTQFGQYMKAYSQGRKEYLLNKTKGSEA